MLQSDAITMVAGDLNQLNTDFIECDNGLVQVVNRLIVRSLLA
jgi:hypothetical protein